MMVSEYMDHPLFYKFFIFPGSCKKKKKKNEAAITFVSVDKSKALI